MGVEKPSRELSIGQIIDQSLALYRSRFVQFFAVWLVGMLLIGFPPMVADIIFPLPSLPEPVTSLEALFGWLSGFLPNVIGQVVLKVEVFWIVNAIVEGLVIKFTSDLLEKGAASLQGAFSFMRSRLASLLAATWITGTLVISGLISLVLPGIILFTIFSLVEQVIMIEGEGALESLARSRRLVRKRWGKVFALFLILIFWMFGVAWVFSLALALPDIVSGAPYVLGVSITLSSVHGIITTAIVALMRPTLTIAFVLLYYSMRAKEEMRGEEGE